MVKKGGHWALVVGVLFIPLTFITAFTGMFSGFMFDSPGSENVWYLPIIFMWFAFVQPLMCLVASISGFVYHAKNKYGTDAKVNRRLIVVPVIYFSVVIVAAIILMIFVTSWQYSHFDSL